jgi:lipopolysaccharide transport system ATP-binding protein
MRGRVGALIELGTGFNPILSGRENAYVNGSILGFAKRDMDKRLEAIVEFSEVGEFIDSPVKNYSSGMKVRLGFAVASQLDPDILLLDEVLAVGDEAFRRKCFDFLYRIQGQGTSFIIVSHNPYAIERMCSRVIVMSHGSVRIIGEAREAIAYYHGLVSDETSATKNTGCDPCQARLGTGAIRVQTVEILDEHGCVADTLEAMKPFAIAVDFIANEKVVGPRFTVEILSSSSALLHTFCTYGLTESLTFDGHHRLVLKIPKLQLMTDVYYVSVKVGRNVRLDTVSSAATFKVVLREKALLNLTGGLGLFISEAKWVVDI